MSNIVFDNPQSSKKFCLPISLKIESIEDYRVIPLIPCAPSSKKKFMEENCITPYEMTREVQLDARDPT